MILIATSVCASILALIYVGLSAHVIVRRRRLHVGVGDGGNHALGIAIRMHGNFAEYVPISLILMFLAELNGTPLPLLALSGTALVTGRILHAWGLYTSHGSSWQRVSGMILTLSNLIVMSLVVAGLLLLHHT